MKHIYTFVLLGLVVETAAQPILTELNSGLQIGQSFTINGGTFVAPPPGGANQVWDFSSQTSLGTTTLQIVDPATTPSGSNFTSEFAETATGSPETRYYDVDPSGQYLDGYANSNGFFISYDGSGSAMLQRPHPCTYQDTWNDNYGGSTFFQGFQLFIDGDITGEADGHGTLEMPWGIVSNVLRIHLLITQTQAIVGAQSDFLEEYYEYYTPGIAYPLLRTYDKKQIVNGGGFVQMDQTLLWMSPIGAGAPESPVAAAITLYPNPAHEAVSVNITGVDRSRVELLDASGRTVRSELFDRSYSGQLEFGLNGIAPGLYTIRISSSDGRLHTQRLVVE